MNVATMTRSEMTVGAIAVPGLGLCGPPATPLERDDTLSAEGGTPGEEL